MIRVLIADDSQEIRNYFNKIIQGESDMEVVDMAESGAQAVEKTIKTNPDIVLMDIQMENNTAGIDAIQKIKAFNPNIKAIVLTIHSRDDLLFRAYAVGTADYIIKTTQTDIILSSIRKVMDNNFLLRPDIANKLMSEYMRMAEDKNRTKEVYNMMLKITNTEYEIIKLVYSGYSYKKIAEQRCVEETTIRSEIYWILKKFKMKKMKHVIQLLRDIDFFETLESE